MGELLKNSIYAEDLKRAMNNIDLSLLKDKSILVTGGCGLICSSVIDLIHFANVEGMNCRIFVADINDEFYAVRYGGYSDIEYIKYDALKPLNFNFAVNYIIHGAGLASPDLYVKAPVETILSNFNGVLNLLNYSKENKVQRLLYISSSEVYGNKLNADSFIEDEYGSADINSVRASYSEAKRASEVLCRSFFSEYGVETVMVRPGHIYGPTASPRDKRISSEFAYFAAKGINLEMKSSGMQKRSYCYCVDCAVAILITLLNGRSGEAYNIGHDEVTTIRRMAEILAKAGKVELKVCEPTVEELKRFNPMLNASLNNDKIKAIGYKDTFTVEEGLTHTVQILKEIYSC